MHVPNVVPDVQDVLRAWPGEPRGEGIFLQFKTEAIEEWFRRPLVIERVIQLRCGFEAGKANTQHRLVNFLILLTRSFTRFAYLLVTTVALECGYPASSIRERIYALPDTDTVSSSIPAVQMQKELLAV